MPGNTIGQIFRVTTFGESHGEMIGVVVDGCPAGLEMDLDFIQKELNRRKPGQSKITTQRMEPDQVRFISGIFEGKTTGAPLCGLIQNKDQRSKDYSHLKAQYRPSHADFTYESKYAHRDHRGGGRASARETAARVVAGGIAKLLLKKSGIEMIAFVSQVGSIRLKKRIYQIDFSQIESNSVRCPHSSTAKKMIELIQKISKEGDTIGGIITGIIRGCPIGLGEPVFDRLHADLGKAMLSIPAVKGFEYGSGFEGAELKGSEHNDPFIQEKGKIKTTTNYSGGIQGGISNGMDIYFRVAFKPVATLIKPQNSHGLEGNNTRIAGKGRHDPCVVPRAVPIVEAMAAITIVDHLLRNRTSRISNSSFQ